MTNKQQITEVVEALEKVSYDVDDEDFNPNHEPVIAFSDAQLVLTKLLEERDERLRKAMQENVHKMWNYPCSCVRLNAKCPHDYSQMRSMLALIKNTN